MSDSILDQANKAALEAVRADKPSSFTVGGRFDGKTLKGGVTYDRSFQNGWGATAYFWAWWDDLPVSVGLKKPTLQAGAEIVKKF